MPITSTTTTPTAVALHSSLSKGGVSDSVVCGSGTSDQVIVTLHKDPQCGASSFGFNVKGGLEFGTPVCIHRVEDGSVAWLRGLRTGQVIHSANGIPFSSITHADALKILRSAKDLSLVLKRDNNGTNLGSNNTMSSDLVGVGSVGSSSYVWVDRTGKVVGPPPPILSSHGSSNQTRLVNLEINPGQNLGLMIRGGIEYGLGIYVTGVDNGSVAARAGLKRGDEIVEVNGYDFGSITHDKAVGVLKSSRKMAILARYVGRIPSDIVSTSQPTHPPTSSDLIDLSKSLVTTGVVSCDEEEEEELLYRQHGDSGNDNEELDYDDFAIEEDKNLELDYGKGLSGRTSDLACIEDDLLLDEATGGGGLFGKKPFGQSTSGSSGATTTVEGMIEEKARTVLTKSEHSRFTFYRVEYTQGFLPIQTFVRILLELLNTAEKYTLLTEVREIIRRPGDLAVFDELVYAKNVARGGIPPGGGVVTSVGGVGLVGQPGYNSNPIDQIPVNLGLPAQQQQTVVPVQQHPQQVLPHHVVQSAGSSSVAGGSGIVSSNSGGASASGSGGGSCVRYKVRVGKTKPILGIAIEGGANTNHRLPRVIDVNTEGSAWGTSLKPGQVLLSVDGKGLDGLSHEEVARLIVDCYMDMSKAQIEFVVVETKSSFLLNQQQVLSHLKENAAGGVPINPMGSPAMTSSAGNIGCGGPGGGGVGQQMQQQRLIN